MRTEIQSTSVSENVLSSAVIKSWLRRRLHLFLQKRNERRWAKPRFVPLRQSDTEVPEQ